MKNIDICLSPELIHLFDLEGKTVVVVDILRATSCMTTALAHGMQGIIPVSTTDECMALKQQGYLTAAERNGEKVDGFDFGNSPFSFMQPELKGKTLAVTTTNGTLAINKSKVSAKEVLVGSFLNISAVANYLIKQENDVVVVCAGWKGKVNIEDSLYAGALVEKLRDDFSSEFDSAIIAHSLYKAAKDDMLGFISTCSHVQRLKRLGIEKDIAFCLTMDEYDVIPVLKGDVLINLNTVAVL